MVVLVGVLDYGNFCNVFGCVFVLFHVPADSSVIVHITHSNSTQNCLWPWRAGTRVWVSHVRAVRPNWSLTFLFVCLIVYILMMGLYLLFHILIENFVMWSWLCSCLILGENLNFQVKTYLLRRICWHHWLDWHFHLILLILGLLLNTAIRFVWCSLLVVEPFITPSCTLSVVCDWQVIHAVELPASECPPVYLVHQDLLVVNFF